MKSLILLLLIASMGFSACKKDDQSTSRNDKPVAEAIIGIWLTTSETYDYFNSKNEKIFTRTVDPGWKYILKELLTVSNPQGQRQYQTPYSITHSNGKNFISFTVNGVTEVFEITSLQLETMSWRQERTNVTYTDNGEKAAAKMVSTFNLHCPCR